VRKQQKYQWVQWLRRLCQNSFLPLLLGIVATIAVLGLWQQLLVREQLHVQELVQQEANAIEIALNRELSARILALEQMASRWRASRGTPQALWEADATSYIAHFYGYQAIEWVDPSSHVRWVVPLKGNESVRNLNLDQEPRRKITFSVARELRQTLLTRTISLAQGGKGFLACVPLFVKTPNQSPEVDRFDGFIVGVFQIQAFFDSILKVSPQYKIQIYNSTSLIYSQEQIPPSTQPKTTIVQAYGADWSVRVFPTSKLILEERSLLPTFVLRGGLAGAWILALTVYLGQCSERYAQRFKRSNQQLQEEIIERQQIEIKLRCSEAFNRNLSERFELAVNSAQIGIWDWDIINDRLTWDDRMYTLYGIQPSNFLRVYQSWAAALHPDDFEMTTAAVQQAIRGERDYDPEFRVVHPDGSIRFIKAYAVVQRNSEGQAQRMIGVNFNISDRKQAEAKLEKELLQSNTLFNTSMDGVVVLNHQGDVVQTSPSFAQMIGYTLEETLKLNTADWDAQWTKGELQQIREGSIVSSVFETRHRRKDGSLYDAEISYSRVQLDGETMHFCIYRDISDRKHKELILRQAMEAAEAANLAKSTFLANMSHELRTPLNVILGFTQLMARDVLLTPNQQEDLQTIRRSGDHLLGLINDVLDLSKIEAGYCTLEETRFDLISLLHTLRTMMTERAKAKRLQLEFDIAAEVPQFVIADEQKLRQILLNLLSNAIKFTNQGSVTLRVKSQSSADLDLQFFEKDRDLSNPSPLHLQFEVIDTGVGIAPTEQGTIFDAFVQAEAGKKSVSGTGLGLTISRKLLDLMNGAIAVESMLNVGTTFTFTIPVVSTSGIDVRPEPHDRLVIGLVPGQPNYRILIVDDQPENRLVLIRLLTHLGLEVREATNGQDAIRIWQDWQPDLTWMDIRMPGLDGYEATKQIRSMEQGQASIIIALTAQASQSDRTLAIAAGCNDYISKPFREETLFLKLKEYLGLEYLYAKPNALPSFSPVPVFGSHQDLPTLLDPALLANLPTSWLDTLEGAALCGNDQAIVDLVSQLSPEFAALSIQLMELTEQFQFEQMIQFIHQRHCLEKQI
jgi:PAS domain S-box-containing protein